MWADAPSTGVGIDLSMGIRTEGVTVVVLAWGQRHVGTGRRQTLDVRCRLKNHCMQQEYFPSSRPNHGKMAGIFSI